MDFQKLYSSARWLEHSSFTLNLEKFSLLNNSLLVLQDENHFKKVLFWGVINCIELDYFIVFGYQTDAITDRKFFYSEDCLNWKLLPVPEREHLILTELCRSPFQGDPGLIIEVVDDAPPEDPSLDEDSSETEEPDKGRTFSEQSAGEEGLHELIEENIDAAAKVVPTMEAGGEGMDKKLERVSEPKAMQQAGQENDEPPITSGELKEEDRLAATVHIISEEVAIVPRGGLFKQTDGVVVHSRAFEGLKVDEADELCSYQHYRTPQQDCNTNLLTRVDYNYAMDFLDTIDKNIPADIWRAQLVEGDRAIILRNLTWQGFTFFHHLETPDHSFIYVGAGQRNLDVPFMTQINEPATKESSESSFKGSKTSKTQSQSSKQVTEGRLSETDDEILLPVAKGRSSENTKISEEIITSA